MIKKARCVGKTKGVKRSVGVIDDKNAMYAYRHLGFAPKWLDVTFM